MLDIKEERRYKRLRKLGQELHLPIPEAFWTVEVLDKDGKVIQRHKQRSHSWTRNIYNFLFATIAGKDMDDGAWGGGNLNVKDTTGTVRNGDSPTIQYTSVSWDGTGYGYRGPAGNVDYGILVGSGTNAEDFEDYALQTKIVEGTGDGQLNHVQSEAHSISYAALVLKNELVRYFNNNSGGNVDVNEVGLHCKAYEPGSVASHYYCMSRDKLASTVTVPDTGQLKVTYTVQLTYPA